MANDIHPRELFRRNEGNPVLKASNFPKMVNAVFNAGATTFENETLLLVRVEMRSGLSHLAVATSAGGRTNWVTDSDRCMLPDLDSYEERWGIEDSRITRIGDEYMITYTGYFAGGPLVCLSATRDFRTFERRGVLMSPDDKDAALFPTTFNDRFALIHRPAPAMSSLGSHAWLSWSPDLRHWGDAKVLIPARRGGWWDANKVGLGLH